MTGIGLVLLFAAGFLAEPTLEEAQSAAARVAAGEAAEDASRAVRLRRAHWAPVLRGQASRRDDVRSRLGEFRGYPLREGDSAASTTWSVTATWDLAQLDAVTGGIYRELLAREVSLLEGGDRR